MALISMHTEVLKGSFHIGFDFGVLTQLKLQPNFKFQSLYSSCLE